MMWIPHLLSLSRLPALVIVVGALHRENLSLAVWGLAWMGLSDGLDGWLARRWGGGGNVGRVLDHVVDKISILTLTWTLSRVRDLPAWVFWLFTVRESASSLASLVVYRHRQLFPRSHVLGRITGAVFVGMLFAYLYWWQYRAMLVWVVVGSAAAATAQYAWIYLRPVSSPSRVSTRIPGEGA
jgi:cardiolipin synthase